MPSFNFLKTSTQNRRASNVSTDSSRSAFRAFAKNTDPSTASSSATSSTTVDDTTSDSTPIVHTSTSDLDKSDDSNARNLTKSQRRFPSISTNTNVIGVDPLDPTRSASVPSIDITSPSSDQPRNLWTPGEEVTEFSFLPSSPTNQPKQGQQQQQQQEKTETPPRPSTSSSSSDEDQLFSLKSSSPRIMPKSVTTQSKNKAEPSGASSSKKGAKAEVLDRHDVMRRAMAEATSSDAFGSMSGESPEAMPQSRAPANGSNGNTVEQDNSTSKDKIGTGSLTFDHFAATPVDGEVIHADSASTTTAVASVGHEGGKASRPRMGSPAHSFHGDEGQMVDVAGRYSDSPAQSPFDTSAPNSATSAVGRSQSISGATPSSGHGRYASTGHTADSSDSKLSSLVVPGSADSPDGKRTSSKHMHESASTSNLPSPFQRLRKLSDSGSTHGKSVKPSSGIAGALAASGMAGMGVGHAALLQQSQSNLTPLKDKRPSSRNSSVGGEYVGGYQGGVYRDPKTGKVMERGPDPDDEEEAANRLRFMRDRSATASTHSLASSDMSVASGLNAAAHFSASTAAQAGLNAGLLGPEEMMRRSSNNGEGPPLTPGGIGAVGGLSPSGLGERVAIGDEDGWPHDMGTQITGFAVASSKRNADFHGLFTSVPEDDYLIEDYGCALVREILIQGRLYVSENHVCFYANIFGWVTNIVLPFSEIVSIEKRMTAYVIPNAIQIATLHSKQTIASFLSRDTTYDLIVNIWKLSHPGVPMGEHQAEMVTDEESVDHHEAQREADHDGDKVQEDSKSKKSARKKLKRKLGIKENDHPATSNGANGDSPSKNGDAISRSKSPAAQSSKKGPHRKTSCPCEKDKKHYSTVALDTTFPSIPEKIYNLIFTSGFMKEFWTDNQKLLDLQLSDWAPNTQNDNMLSRNITYIKPLTGSFGPKQTKCVLSEENIHVDFDEYVVALTTTRTPDVPSGGSFSVKTRTCLTWAGGNVTKVYVTCQVDWTGRSMVKGIIDRASIDGQKQYYKDLDVAIRKYIKDHASEFREEGDDESAKDEIAAQAESGIEAQESKDKEADGSASTSDSEAKEGLAKFFDIAGNTGSFIFDTLSDVFGTITDMASGTSLSVLVLGFVVFLLVVSNLWALGSSSSRDPLDPHKLRSSSHSSSRSKSLKNSHQQDSEAAQYVAIAVREVLQDYFDPSSRDALMGSRVQSGKSQTPRIVSDDPFEELQSLLAILEDVESRVANVRTQLKSASEGQSSASLNSRKRKR